MHRYPVDVGAGCPGPLRNVHPCPTPERTTPLDR
jgi:hypothetical protein